MQTHGCPVTLVLGGVRSGKSRYELHRVTDVGQMTFIATAQALDEEMRIRIERHRMERPAHWRTLEAPLQLAEALEVARQQGAEAVVVDCLTLWVSNLMGEHGEDLSAIYAAFDALCSVLKQYPIPAWLVSNEVGSGVVPAFEMGRLYRDLLGELNQRVASIAGEVTVMIAGLPLFLKSIAGAQS